jgi:hypothetical protein
VLNMLLLVIVGRISTPSYANPMLLCNSAPKEALFPIRLVGSSDLEDLAP